MHTPQFLLPFSPSHHDSNPCVPTNPSQKTGEICLDLLKNAWSAVYTLQAVCRAIINLLAHPEADSPLNCDCGNLLRSGDSRGYNSMAKMYAKLYGSPEHMIQGETQ